MNKFAFALIALLSLSLVPAIEGRQPVETQSNDKALLDQLVALERGALDKWIRRDPQGYLDLYAPDVTYFDPFRDARLDGIDAIKAMVNELVKAPNPVTDARYEMLGARVQQYGDIAILTFHSISYGRIQGRPESVLARWNCTETYRRAGGQWRIVHSHWSFTKPDIKPPVF